MKNFILKFCSIFMFLLLVGGMFSHSVFAKDGDEQKYPIEIKHAFGTTVIDKKPERVATIAWNNQDVPLALNVMPVGFSMANYGVQDESGMLPWTKEKVDELEKKGDSKPVIFKDTDGLDFEAIASTKPDVILAAYSGITKEDYEKLSKIAPVVPYEKAPWVTTWRDTILKDSDAMGMKAQGEALIKDLEGKINDAVSKYPDIKDKKVVFGSFSADDLSKFYLYTVNDPRANFLTDMGMKYIEGVDKLVEQKDSFYATVSAEKSDILNDADIIVTYGNEGLLKALQENPVLGKIKAIKNGAVAVIGDGTPLAAAGTQGPLSIPYTINDYAKLMADSAKNVK